MALTDAPTAGAPLSRPLTRTHRAQEQWFNYLIIDYCRSFARVTTGRRKS